MRRTPSVGRMLRTAFSFPIACILLAGLAGLAALWRADAAVGDLAERLPELRDHNAAALQALVDAETGERGYLISGDEAFLEPYLEGRAAFAVELSRARALAAGDAELVAALDEERRTGERWLGDFGGPVVALAGTDLEAARARAATGEGRRILDRYRVLNTRTAAILAQRTSDTDRAVGRSFALNAAGIALLALATATAGWFSATRATRRVTEPLDGLRDAVGRLADGELDARVDPAGPVEIQELAASVNDLAGQMQVLNRLQQERLDRERLRNRIARHVRADLDPNGVLQRAVGDLGPAIGVDRALVRFVDDDGVGPVQAVWLAPGVEPLPDAQCRRLSGPANDAFLEAVRRQESLAIDDVAALDGLVDVGSFGDLQAVLAVPLTAGDKAVGMLVLHDVTGPRHWSWHIALVEALAHDLAGALAHSLAYERLRELDREKATFVSSVSHELRTPLTSIIGYVEMLADGDAGPLADEQLELLGVVERSTGRLLALIEDLLTLSRIESGSFRPSFASVDVGSVLAGALETLGPTLGDRSIELDVELEDGLPPLWGDVAQLERVLFNLVSNAGKFSPDGSTVSVSATRAGEDAVLTVCDRGIGIPVEEQANLFTRFFRSSTSTALAIKGTGLGLTIVRNIVEQHGGRIALESAPGAGTTVRVFLPFAAPVPMGVA